MSKAKLSFLFAVALLVSVSLACGSLGKNNQDVINTNSNSLITISNSKTTPTPNTDSGGV